MVNAYSELLSYKGNEWRKYLEEMCLYDVFDGLFTLFSDTSSISQSIQYIVLSYSLQSNAVVSEMDWLKNKNEIFGKSLLPMEHYASFVLLENEVILKTIQKWVDFQDSQIFSQLCMLKDLQVEMQLSANSPIKKSSGEIDYSQKFLNATYVKDLISMIRDCENELVQNTPKLKEAYKEVSTALNKIAKNTMGIESILKERK